METRICKCYNPIAEIEFEPNAFIQQQFGSMNSTLKYLTELKPDFVEKYVQHLITRIKNAITSLEKKDGFYDFPANEENFEFLDKYPELREVTREFLLMHLNPLKKSPNDDKKFIVFGLNDSMAFRRISYHRVKSFAELLGKEEGLKLYTKIVTLTIEEFVKKNPQKSDIVFSDRLNKSIENWCKIGMADFVCGNIDKHMTIFRFDSCYAHETLKEFNDPDIAYAASCYASDLPVFNKGRIIKLRRTQTLHHGAFCDELYWDSRVHDNPEQPSLDYTRKIGGENK
ncbi:MAG: hypothetical protein ACTSO7_15530 [Candidatus Heimdallarchaeota archaeon]